MSKQAPPRSIWSRSSRLISLAAGLAKKELQGRVSQAVDRGDELVRQARALKVQVEQAREIVESLGQLKGASMKEGQLSSMELRDVLPPEVIEVLSQLQASGATVDFEEVESILREELGAERLAQLEVSRVPLASASIGQVHRATWRSPDGALRDVVLKVQLRGIAETIDSDLALLERIARLFLTVQLKHFDLRAVFGELRDVLVRETDYVHEADALERYRALAHQVPGLLAHQVPGLRVPEVFHGLCTKRVLALSFEDGLTLDAFMATSPTVEHRHRVATQVLDLYFLEFFDWGLVQTDANFANFLFRPQTGELVLLDFGATREYPAAFREQYRALLTSTLRGDRPGAYAAALELNLISPEEPQAGRDALHGLLETVLRVFQPAFQPVDFRDKRFVDEAGDHVEGQRHLIAQRAVGLLEQSWADHRVVPPPRRRLPGALQRHALELAHEAQLVAAPEGQRSFQRWRQVQHAVGERLATARLRTEHVSLDPAHCAVLEEAHGGSGVNRPGRLRLANAQVRRSAQLQATETQRARAVLEVGAPGLEGRHPLARHDVPRGLDREGGQRPA